MTSSVDYAGPDLSLPRLQVPDWLPGAVADRARALYQNILQKDWQRDSLSAEARQSWHDTSLNKIELLRRLTSDTRMEGVWRELYRQRRGPRDEFLNPAIRVGIMFGPTLPILHDPKNQDEACQEFLGTAFWLAVQPSSLPKQEAINFRHESMSGMAERLRQDAQNLISFGLSGIAADMQTLAVRCENNAKQPDRDKFNPVVKRSRGDQVLRAYVVRLSIFCRETFEKWLPGTVATTAKVAFSKEISGRQVREMVRDIPKGCADSLESELKGHASGRSVQKFDDDDDAAADEE